MGDFTYTDRADAPRRHAVIAMRAASGQTPQQIAAVMRMNVSAVYRVINHSVVQDWIAELQEEIQFRQVELYRYLDEGRLAGLEYLVQVAKGEVEDAEVADRIRVATALMDRHPDMQTAKGSKKHLQHQHRAVLDVEVMREIEELSKDAAVRLAAIDVQVLPAPENSDDEDTTEDDATEEIGDAGIDGRDVEDRDARDDDAGAGTWRRDGRHHPGRAPRKRTPGGTVF